VDCVLFAHLVELKDAQPEALPQPYERLFADVRKCVDLCHRDGVIKDRVAEVSHLYNTYVLYM
jgi:5'-nucleotidase